MGEIKRWWGEGKVPNLRHADRLLGQAAGLEVQVCEGRMPLDRSLSEYRAARPKMGSNDRALLSLALYGLARNRDAFRQALPELAPGSGALLSVALYDSIQGGETLAAEPVSGHLGRLHAFRDDLVRRVCAAWGSPLGSPESAEALSVLFSMPVGILQLGPWKTVGEAASELNNGRFPQSPQLRVQINRMSREEAIARLAATNISAAATNLSPWGLVLSARMASGALGGLPIEFQDEGSQLAALACLPLGPGAKALDYCAGSGGKGLALGEASECQVYLHDADHRRLAAALPRIGKSGAGNVKIVERPDVEAPYDLVLVDAPCTSTGTMRRNPDITWRWSQGDVSRFSRVQLSLLHKAAELVKPLGLLVYSTCSLLDAENHKVVESFLGAGRDFHPEAPEHPSFASIPGAAKGMMRLPMGLPGYSGDGFFIARLRKSA